MQATSLEGLAREMVVPMFGYSSLEEYLRDWSPCNRLDGITIPVLAVNAHNDPFCPPNSKKEREREREREVKKGQESENDLSLSLSPQHSL